jgi:hypothetical protein
VVEAVTDDEFSDEVEQMARDLFEGYGTRTWKMCTDQRYWLLRAVKLVESGWRKCTYD